MSVISFGTPGTLNQQKSNYIVFEVNSTKWFAEMPFCIEMSYNICVIGTVSAKTCVFGFAPWDGALGHSLVIFCPRGCGFAAFFAWQVGISSFQKTPQGLLAWGSVNSCN